MTTRRDFLLGGVALGFCGCSKVEVPKWLEAALKRMREEDRPGLLFRLPADKDARCALGHGITHGLLNSADPDIHEVLSEAALLCLDTAAVDDRFRGARRSDTLLLVDGDGYAVDGMVFEAGEQWQNFLPAARALLHGPGGRRLSERAERARKRASKDALALLSKPELDPEARLLPLVVQERLSAAEPRKTALRAAVEARWTSSSTMPYGVETTLQMKGGCGACGCEEAPPRNLMVACGMAIMVKNARHFVKFLR